MIEDLEEVKARNTLSSSAVDIDFNASGRKTRELLVAKGIAKSMGGQLLFGNLDLTLRPGERLGVLGTNGSGKTTLLKISAGQIEPDQGTIKRASELKVIWFDQNRQQLDKQISLREALCPSGDSVVYRGRSLHVASWARRFLFAADQLNLPVSHLSGGEQARILIARLMLAPADVLILDEPTNDLDIPTLEVLEDSLMDFPGALVLVTHDRFMLDNVSNLLLALDGRGSVSYFSGYQQWQETKDSLCSRSEPIVSKAGKQQSASGFKPLSTAEKKELSSIHEQIEAAEQLAARLRSGMEDPEIACDHLKLQNCLTQIEQAELEVTRLYDRWQDLESRKSQ